MKNLYQMTSLDTVIGLEVQLKLVNPETNDCRRNQSAVLPDTRNTGEK